MAGGRGKEADIMGVCRGWRFPMTGGMWLWGDFRESGNTHDAISDLFHGKNRNQGIPMTEGEEKGMGIVGYR